MPTHPEPVSSHVSVTFCVSLKLSPTGEALVEAVTAQRDSSECSFKRIERPAVGSVVLMYDSRTERPEHIGVIITRGQVLHSRKKRGSIQTSLRTIKRMFAAVEYYEYACDSTNAA